MSNNRHSRDTCQSGGACLECDGNNWEHEGYVTEIRHACHYCGGGVGVEKSQAGVLSTRCLICHMENGALPTQATRHNSGKVDLTLLPHVAALEECKVWMYGERRYTRNNWKKLWGDKTVQVAGASAMRHLMSLINGEMYDRESGLPNASHVRCNMAMILEWMANEGMIRPEVYEEKGEKE